MKNNTTKLVLILCLISAIAAGLLAFLNEMTKDTILKTEELASSGPEVAQAVVPGAVSFELSEDKKLVDTIKLENDKFIELRICKDASGTELGYGIRTLSTVPGYGGDVEIFAGVSKEGKLVGMKVLSHAETVGLGAKIEDGKFQSQFIGKDTNALIKVTKSSPKEDEILALSGATYSSKSVTSAINNAMYIYNEYLKK